MGCKLLVKINGGRGGVNLSACHPLRPGGSVCGPPVNIELPSPHTFTLISQGEGVRRCFKMQSIDGLVSITTELKRLVTFRKLDLFSLFITEFAN